MLQKLFKASEYFFRMPI